MLLLAYDATISDYGPAIDKLSPYRGTLSGERENQKPSYNYGPPSTKFPILALEDDIINSDGYGLKRGFYEVRIDDNNEFLLFVQSGKLKAKIPVVLYENNKKDKKDKYKNLSAKEAQKQYRKELKQKEKERKKYIKGENPKDIVFSNVKLTYDTKNDCWLVFWELEEQKAIGCFRN